MSKLVAIVYDDMNQAGEVLEKVRELEKEELIDLEDAVYVTRDLEGKVKLHQTESLAGVGAASGALWGMLIGLLFFAPFLGMAIGAGTGALSGSLADAGVDDKFMKKLGEEMVPGSSAIFLLVRRVTADKVVDELSQFGGKIMTSSLSKEREREIQDALDKGMAGQAYASEIK